MSSSDSSKLSSSKSQWPSDAEWPNNDSCLRRCYSLEVHSATGTLKRKSRTNPTDMIAVEDKYLKRYNQDQPKPVSKKQWRKRQLYFSCLGTERQRLKQQRRTVGDNMDEWISLGAQDKTKDIEQARRELLEIQEELEIIRALERHINEEEENQHLFDEDDDEDDHDEDDDDEEPGAAEEPSPKRVKTTTAGLSARPPTVDASEPMTASSGAQAIIAKVQQMRQHAKERKARTVGPVKTVITTLSNEQKNPPKTTSITPALHVPEPSTGIAPTDGDSQRAAVSMTIALPSSAMSLPLTGVQDVTTRTTTTEVGSSSAGPSLQFFWPPEWSMMHQVSFIQQPEHSAATTPLAAPEPSSPASTFSSTLPLSPSSSSSSSAVSHSTTVVGHLPSSPLHAKLLGFRQNGRFQSRRLAMPLTASESEHSAWARRQMDELVRAGFGVIVRSPPPGRLSVMLGPTHQDNTVALVIAHSRAWSTFTSLLSSSDDDDGGGGDGGPVLDRLLVQTPSLVRATLCDDMHFARHTAIVFFQSTPRLDDYKHDAFALKNGVTIHLRGELPLPLAQDTTTGVPWIWSVQPNELKSANTTATALPFPPALEALVLAHREDNKTKRLRDLGVQFFDVAIQPHFEGGIALQDLLDSFRQWGQQSQHHPDDSLLFAGCKAERLGKIAQFYGLKPTPNHHRRRAYANICWSSPEFAPVRRRRRQ